jgi:hypothetical protein
MPVAAVTHPRKFRTKAEWRALAEAVDDLDCLPGPALWRDLVADGRRIIDQAVAVARWAGSVSEFFDAVERYFERHPPPEGPAEGLDPDP